MPQYYHCFCSMPAAFSGPGLYAHGQHYRLLSLFFSIWFLAPGHFVLVDGETKRRVPRCFHPLVGSLGSVVRTSADIQFIQPTIPTIGTIGQAPFAPRGL